MNTERFQPDGLEQKYGSCGKVYSHWLSKIKAYGGDEQSEEVYDELLRWDGSLDWDSYYLLRDMSDQAQLSSSNEVRQGRDDLRNIMTFLRDDYQQEGYKLILYGSLQYGDPRNMDFDLMAVRPSSISREESRNLNYISDFVNIFWQSKNYAGKPREEGHISHFGIEDAERLSENLDLSAEKVDIICDRISAVITGIPLFPNDARDVDTLRLQAIEVAENDPFIGASTNYLMRSVRNIREHRLIGDYSVTS